MIMRGFVGVALLLLMTTPWIAHCQAPTVFTVTPTSGPISGGTLLSVTGEGFVTTGTGRSKCTFRDSSYGSAISTINHVYNSSYLTCVLPNIAYLPQSVLAGGHRVQLVITAGISLHSNEMSILLFDLAMMHITGITPAQGLNDTQNNLTVHGNGFVDTSECVCVINGDTLTVTPANVLNSTLVECSLPTYPSAAQVNVMVYLNGQVSASIQPLNTGANTFTFFVAAPTLQYCEFSSSYVSLFLNFDREMEIGAEDEYNTTHLPDCIVVFSDTSLHLLGNGTTCSWQNTQQRTLVVTLTAMSSVGIGSELSLRGDNIRTRAVQYSRFASGFIQVRANSKTLLPIAVLDAPEYINSCGNFVVTGEHSQHGGYAPLKYRWLVGHNYSSLGMLMQDSTLLPYIPQAFTDIPALVVPNLALFENITYSLQLTVKNFLGLESTVFANITKHNGTAPELLILGNPERKVIVNGEIRLEGVVTKLDCLNGSGVVDYLWTIGSLTGQDQIPLDSVNTNTSVLVIPPHTLDPASVFVAKLTATLDGLSSAASVRLVTEYVEIRARINNGVRRTLGQGDDIVLDGTPSEGIHNATDVSILWQCYSARVPQMPCNNSAHLKLELSNCLYHTIPANTLPPGQYNFALTLQLLNTSSTAYQIIDILPYSVPCVTIRTRHNPHSVLTHQKLILDASISSTHPGVVEWSSEYVPGYAQLKLSANNTRTFSRYTLSSNVDEECNETAPILLVSTNTSHPITNAVSLVIKKDKLLPGNWYRFRVKVVGNHTGFAEIDICTESRPLGGHLELKPAEGYGLSTMFSLRALQWTDDVGDTPLSYQFGFQYEDGNKYWLSGIQVKNQISTLLPSLCSGQSVSVFVHIYDQALAYTERVSSVTLQKANETTELLSAIEEIERLSLWEGNWVEGVANLMAISVSVNRCPEQFNNVTEFKQQAIDLVLRLHRTIIPSSRSHLSQLLVLLQQVSFQANLSHSTLSDITSLLELAVTQYNTFTVSITDVVPGISPSEAGVIFGLYSDLIVTNSQCNVTLNSVKVLIDSLLEITSKLGHGMCLQMGIHESPILIVKDIGTLKVSYTNLPAIYHTTNGSISDVITVQFGNVLSQVVLQRPCGEHMDKNSSKMCSGACVISVQLMQDMMWQDSEYSPPIRTEFLQLALLDPATGKPIDVSDLQPDISRITLPIIGRVTDYDQLTCLFRQDSSIPWAETCITLALDSSHMECQCTHITGGQIIVVEKCPSGYYGNACMEECPQGLWGEKCTMSCDCDNRGTCSAHDGSCDCIPGWTGDTCQFVCPKGMWGLNCSEVCLCENGADCSPVNGSCSCLAGWVGLYCDLPCPDGMFGDYCASVCECRDISECDRSSGVCRCQPGYTGHTCHSACTQGSYGTGCALQCSCNMNGTISCHHINGTCYCHDEWEGEFCETLVAPSPVVLPNDGSNGIEVWWLVPPVILGITAVVIFTIAIALCWLKHRKSKKSIYPILMETAVSEGIETRVKGVVAENDDNFDLQMTKGQSLEVLMPRGSKLSDIFFKQEGKDFEQGAFREPAEMNGKLRWQVAKLLNDSCESLTQEEKPLRAKVRFQIGDSRSEVDPELNAVDREQDGQFSRQKSLGVTRANSENLMEVVYECGVYLNREATLKELRNSFVDSNQLADDDRFFRFLQSDILGEYVDVDTEDEVLLSQIEGRLVPKRTLFIESVDLGTVRQELCVCGKFADLECTECESRGYCSEKCQHDDWHKHEMVCRVISAKRKRQKKRKRKRDKEQQGSGRKSRGADSQVTLPEDMCICGKTAKFECSLCAKQAYCSKGCQNEDWSFHQYYCQSDKDSPQHSSTHESGHVQNKTEVESPPLPVKQGKVVTPATDAVKGKQETT